MYIEEKPFPYLDQSQFAGREDGEIFFLDESIPEEKRNWLREEYKKWWNEREEKLFEQGKM